MCRGLIRDTGYCPSLPPRVSHELCSQALGQSCFDFCLGATPAIFRGYSWLSTLESLLGVPAARREGIWVDGDRTLALRHSWAGYGGVRSKKGKNRRRTSTWAETLQQRNQLELPVAAIDPLALPLREKSEGKAVVQIKPIWQVVSRSPF